MDLAGPRTNWLVRTRLCLLAVVSAAAAALATASFIRAVGAFQRDSADSNVSSMRDGAIASAILALLFAGVILAVGLCSALILIRSVLRPLRQLRHLLWLLHPQVRHHIELTRMQPVSTDLPDVLLDELGQSGHK